MIHEHVLIEQSPALSGTVPLVGAKNAVLVSMASLILTAGLSKLTNVPFSNDVEQMIQLLRDLGASILVDYANNSLEIDTTDLCHWRVNVEIMKKMRASILVMGPLLARFGKADIALPGGCLIGARPIDFHLKAFAKMGVTIETSGEYLTSRVTDLKAQRFVLEYPSVGATENIMMAATRAIGTTHILNAALEPEVFDLIEILQKMGASIAVEAPATIVIQGVKELRPLEHKVMYDRLEAGSLLLAAAITGGEIIIPEAPTDYMDVFLVKLQEMGHEINKTADGKGLHFKATKYPQAVSFKTMPYPGFPTDLQAPMTAALCLASGTSIVHETVFENRLLHVRELQKMGAQISIDNNTATIKGVEQLYGAQVIATDIRASCALVLAGLAATGQTTMTGVHHLKRGYQGFAEKIAALGGKVAIKSS
ncbi:UDP-N-acetylglucosamine 1-carboxyvinyltransferase [Candidatus Dependentiae bacterium]|nr:UDP-N-acetylglucosamine 1-carboxyvinyltransferase [Candidatus Dependentiae bacterium]